jgi:hypothetical protein
LKPLGEEKKQDKNEGTKAKTRNLKKEVGYR